MVPMSRLAAVVVFCSALALSCSTGDAGNPSGGNAPPAASAAPASPSPPPTDAVGLAALLRQGLSSVTSTHVTLDISAAGQRIQGEGDQKLVDGAVQAIDLTQEIGSFGRLRVIIVDRSTYAQLPPELNQSGKPWVLVTQNSSNPTVRTLATSLESVQNSASLEQFTTFTTAASRVRFLGSDSFDGAPVTHYSIDMDITKLPSSMPGLQMLLGAGVTTVPIEMYIDGQGRPVKVTSNFPVQGQPVSSVITLSRFNEPVSITAPPADQVSTS
jgi:hypothetical protein